MVNSPLLKWLYINLFIKNEIRKLNKYGNTHGARLLDVGCGTGWTSRIYADSVLELYHTPSPLYFPPSFVRKLRSKRAEEFIKKHRVGAMMAGTPLAVFGSLLHMGDNLNLVVRKR